MVDEKESAKGIAIGVIIGLISNVLLALIGFLFNYYFGSDLFNVKIHLWVMVAIILMVIPIVVMLVRSHYISKNISFVVKDRPLYPIHTRTFEMNRFGVKWKVLYYDNPLSLEKPYAFADGGPYCPDCDYEMQTEKRGIITKKYFWKCYRCNKSYKCDIKDPYKAREIVERLLESEIKSGRLKL